MSNSSIIEGVTVSIPDPGAGGGSNSGQLVPPNSGTAPVIPPHVPTLKMPDLPQKPYSSTPASCARDARKNLTSREDLRVLSEMAQWLEDVDLETPSTEHSERTQSPAFKPWDTPDYLDFNAMLDEWSYSKVADAQQVKGSTGDGNSPTTQDKAKECSVVQIRGPTLENPTQTESTWVAVVEQTDHDTSGEGSAILQPLVAKPTPSASQDTMADKGTAPSEACAGVNDTDLQPILTDPLPQGNGEVVGEGDLQGRDTCDT